MMEFIDGKSVVEGQSKAMYYGIIDGSSFNGFSANMLQHRKTHKT